MNTAKETAENVSSLAAFCLPKTRVWGSRAENQAFIGAGSWLSSTSRWGCQYCCDGIASGEIVQRYYSSTYGRFNKPDPANAGALNNPQSLNLYAYVLGDPINHMDPEGLCDVLIGGITESPSGPTTNWAQDNGAISAFPYAGGSVTGGVADVIQQGVISPNYATTVALNAIALAAQNPGQLDIVAFSGGAQAFTTAFGLLKPEIQNRIASITYIDPGGVGGLAGGTTNTSVTVLGDDSDLINRILQISAGSPTNPQPAAAQYVDTGNCGHSLDCVINHYGEYLATNGVRCDTGAGGVFGLPPTQFSFRPTPGFVGLAGYWIEIPLIPKVTETIKYPPEGK